MSSGRGSHLAERIDIKNSHQVRTVILLVSMYIHFCICLTATK